MFIFTLMFFIFARFRIREKKSLHKLNDGPVKIWWNFFSQYVMTHDAIEQARIGEISVECTFPFCKFIWEVQKDNLANISQIRTEQASSIKVFITYWLFYNFADK